MTLVIARAIHPVRLRERLAIIDDPRPLRATLRNVQSDGLCYTEAHGTLCPPRSAKRWHRLVRRDDHRGEHACRSALNPILLALACALAVRSTASDLCSFERPWSPAVVRLGVERDGRVPLECHVAVARIRCVCGSPRERKLHPSADFRSWSSSKSNGAPSYQL